MSSPSRRVRVLAQATAVLLLAGGGLGCPSDAAPAKNAGADKPVAKNTSARADDRATKEKTSAKAKPDTAKPAAPAKPPADGWTRLELSSVAPGLSGTIDLPTGVEAKANEAQTQDADGLQTSGIGVKIGPAVGGVELRAHGVIPPRFESAQKMLAFHAQFEKVSTHEHGPGHFSVVQKWRPGECMLHGWSQSAGLSCNVFKAPCDEIEQWVNVCATLQPGASPNAPETTAKTAFEGLDPAAGAVAIAVAQGVARNDASLFLKAISSDGVKIGKKTYDAATLEAALPGKTVLGLVAPNVAQGADTPAAEFYAWNADGPPSDAAEANVWFFTGYGEQPFFKLKKNGEAWQLVEFGLEDLGEP